MNEPLALKATGNFLHGEIHANSDMESPEVSAEAWGRVGAALADALRKEGIPHRIEAHKGHRLCCVESRDLWPPAVYNAREGVEKPEPPAVQLDPACCLVFTRLSEMLDRVHDMIGKGIALWMPGRKKRAKAAKRKAKP